MLGRHNWAVGVIQHLCRGRAQEHAAEAPSMSRHNDKVKRAGPGDLGDLRRRFACAQDSDTGSRWKLRLEKRIEFFPRDAEVVFSDLPQRSAKQFKSVVAVKIADIHQADFGAEHLRCALHVSSHGRAGWRKVNRKENLPDHRLLLYSGL
jgi:hypothetical protein